MAIHSGLTRQSHEVGAPFPAAWIDVGDGLRVKVRYEKCADGYIMRGLLADAAEADPDDNHVHFMDYLRDTTIEVAPGGVKMERYDRVIARVKIDGGLSGDDRDAELNRGHLLNKIESLLGIRVRD
jgi:hypothetical protein